MATIETVVTSHADGWNFLSASAVIVNTTIAVALESAVAAPSCNCIASLQVAHDIFGAPTELAIRDDADGTVLWQHKLQTATNENMTFDFDGPLKGSPGNLLKVATVTAVTGGVFCTAQGFVAP